jgi:hypothetical protein
MNPKIKIVSEVYNAVGADVKSIFKKFNNTKELRAFEITVGLLNEKTLTPAMSFSNIAAYFKIDINLVDAAYHRFKHKYQYNYRFRAQCNNIYKNL